MAAEHVECTVWLFSGFLAAVRRQAALGSEFSLQMQLTNYLLFNSS